MTAFKPRVSKAAQIWNRRNPPTEPVPKVLRAAGMGHEDAFSRPRLSARCRFGQATFAATQRKGRDALKPVVRGAARGSNLYLRRPVPAQLWSIDRPCWFFSAS